MTRVLFLIPARAGSRRIPGKSLKTVAGIPLVGRAARLARTVARRLANGPHLVVCTTDDPAIGAVAREWGADFVLDRPAELASDTASSADVVAHALETLARTEGEFQALVLLQPTSPLTEPADVFEALRRFDSGNGTSVVSVSASHPAAWHRTLDPASNVFTNEAAASQESNHLLSGSFYVIDPARFRADPRFVIPGESSGVVLPAERAVDVDEPSDLVLAEAFAAARPVRSVPFGDRMLGQDESVFVIAEAGVNHDGDLKQAHALVDAAADAGADAVKFQTFDPAALVAPSAPTADYQRVAGEGDNQQAMLARLTLPANAWSELQAHASERGLVFLSTAFDTNAAAMLDRLDVPGFKIGSGELTNIPFLRAVARFGRPMLLSTGMANMREVAEAVDAVNEAGNPPLALFHCVSNYPASAADANLRAIAVMRAAFSVPVGWSDHTPGMDQALSAVALGASMIEKHLTLDRTAAGPDHAASMESGPFGEMVRAIRRVSAGLGDGLKRPTAAELEVAAVARRSLHWARDLEAGAVVENGDLLALRPLGGLPPSEQERVVGRRTRQAVVAGTQVTPESLEDSP